MEFNSINYSWDTKFLSQIWWILRTEYQGNPERNHACYCINPVSLAWTYFDVKSCLVKYTLQSRLMAAADQELK